VTNPKIKYMKQFLVLLFSAFLFGSCAEKKTAEKPDFMVADGQMPAVCIDQDTHLQVVYGWGDSILYTSSTDNGKSFASPQLVSVLPGAFSFAMRGPQIASTGAGLVITAPTASGDIYSFYKSSNGAWQRGARINDLDTVAKEGLMALSAGADAAWAVWLDVRGNQGNKIVGAKTTDGGKTWQKNVLIYASPDGSVCQCCKPSVVLQGANVYVMFRNWLNGNRDLYLATSHDGGETFSTANKIGDGTWKLDGCPMDGGAIAVDGKQVQTVWRREGKIYACEPGSPEKVIGEGRGCTVANLAGKNCYAWSENGEVIILDPMGIKRKLGKGSQPQLQALNAKQGLCLWENERQVHAAIFSL
jgi:hypothetical protein